MCLTSSQLSRNNNKKKFINLATGQRMLRISKKAKQIRIRTYLMDLNKLNLVVKSEMATLVDKNADRTHALRAVARVCMKNEACF